MRENNYISGLDFGKNNVHDEIFYLQGKNNQAIIEKFKELYHNFSPDDSNRNDAQPSDSVNNNSDMRPHVVGPPHEGEIDYKDDPIDKDETDENIGHQEENFVSKLKITIGFNNC